MVAGTYNYECTPHQFTGQFIATGNIGIDELKPGIGFNVYSNGASAYSLSYELTRSSNIEVSLFDITGKGVRLLINGFKNAGGYTELFDLSDLKKGIYLVQFVSEEQRLTKRIVIE
jgi:hypothetical protein